MNNIEKSAIEKMIYEHTGFNPNVADDAKTIKHIKNLLEAFAKALQQSSEPVAKVLFRQDEDGLEAIAFYSNDEAPAQEKLKDRFVILDVHLTPPSSVPLEKYNKLLEQRDEAIKALGDLSFECFAGIGLTQPSIKTYNETFSVLDKLRKAIAEAEGKS